MYRPSHFIACLTACLPGLLFVPPAAAEALPDPRPDHWYRHIVDIDFVRPYAVIPPRAGAVLIDTRDTVRRYDAGHLPGAINLPAAQFDQLASALLPADKTTSMLIYCGEADARISYAIAGRAEALGYRHIVLLAGGYAAWERFAR